MSVLAHARSSAGWIARVLRAAHAFIQRCLPRRARNTPIKETAAALDRDGAVVFARATGFPTPPILNGYRPDVYAVYDDHEIALSVASRESMEAPALDRQASAFIAWADEAPEREYSQVVVPRRGSDTPQPQSEGD